MVLGYPGTSIPQPNEPAVKEPQDMIRKAFSAVLLLMLTVLTGCMSVDISGLMGHELEEITLREPSRLFVPDRVAVLDIAGVISTHAPPLFGSATCTPDGVRAVLKKLEQDPRVKALVLRINSPGGGVTATDMMHHEIRRFKEKTAIPVIAVFMDVACSGGYYLATAADAIYAHPTTITGSIGVIATFPKWQGLAGKIGYEQVVVKSGEMKDIGNPMREMSAGERKVFQDMIDDMYGRFLTTVVEGRRRYATPAELRPVADGRIYTAQQALELGLIDGICHLDQALDKALEAAGIRDARVIAYVTKDVGDPTIYSTLDARLVPGKLLNVDLPGVGQGSTPGFHYLWMPGE